MPGRGGVLAGVAAPASVIAKTPMRTLRLPTDVYESFLRELPEVELNAAARGLGVLDVADGLDQIASNTAETQVALRAAGAAERDPVLRNPDWTAAIRPAQPRLIALATVPGMRGCSRPSPSDWRPAATTTRPRASTTSTPFSRPSCERACASW